MAVTVQNLIDLGDFLRRSDEVGTANITTAKKIEAAALAVEDIHNQAFFRFTQRVQRFDYLKDEADYVMGDNATNYEASVRIADFKGHKDLRAAKDHNDDFDFVDPNAFAITYGGASTVKEYTVEYRDGSKVLRINNPGFGTKTDVHAANNFNNNGTWAVDSTNSDATNIGTDSVVFVNKGGSIKFDTDVSQSVNNRVTISVSDMTSIDLSDFQNTGIIRMWVYIPGVTDDTSNYVESVELRWGSSSTAYWSLTASQPANNFKFQDRWNLLEFQWREAAETGTVDETKINHVLVTVNYNASQADDTGFRINDIRIYNPVELKLTYFSSFTIQTSTTSGIWFDRVKQVGNVLLAPDRYKNCYAFAYNYYLSMFENGPDSEITEQWLRKYKGDYDRRTRKWRGGELEILVREQGERVKIKQSKLKPQLSFK